MKLYLNIFLYVIWVTIMVTSILIFLRSRKLHEEIKVLRNTYNLTVKKRIAQLTKDIDEHMKKGDLKIGTKVIFHTGNFAGLTGVISMLNWHSDDTRALYGYLHIVELSDGRIGFIEKSEHFTIDK